MIGELVTAGTARAVDLHARLIAGLDAPGPRNRLIDSVVAWPPKDYLARACALNVLAQLQAAAGSLDAVAQLVKITVFVASAAGFTQQPQVADGASQLLIDVLGPAGAHARSAVGVAALPLGTPVEVGAIAELSAAAANGGGTRLP